MKIFGIIPARMGSSRFSGKPMASILGMPMIGHVYHRSKMCPNLNDVWVATCDEEIFNYIHSIGGKAVMTADSHQRASDRAAEAVINIEKIEGIKVDYVAMIQGDEPMLNPEMIDDLVAPVLRDASLQVINLIEMIHSQEDFENENLVKVVLDQEGYALYFSREPIPSKKKYTGEITMWKQLGIILFGRKALLDYAKMIPTPLEIIESVDMNRFLEHGIKIKMIPTVHKTYGVDVPADIHAVEPLLRKDAMTERYLPGINMQ